MAWGYEKSFVVEHDHTLTKRISCRDCWFYVREDKSCGKRPLYLPEDGFNSWRKCEFFELDPSTSKYKEKLEQLKLVTKKKRKAGEMATSEDSDRENIIPADEFFFFNNHAQAFPLYVAFREAVIRKAPEVKIKVKKTQISFFNMRMFAAVSFAPVRKVKERPNPFLTISFGLPYRKESSRIDAATEAYPKRWTHHVMVGMLEEIDAELISWIVEAAAFAKRK